MRIRELVGAWVQHPSHGDGGREVRVCLPLQRAAQVAALAEMFADGDEQAVLAQLVGAAIDEIETAFPYVQGEKVAEDEQGDPVYADAGFTPTFLELTRRHYERLQRDPACRRGPAVG